MYHVSVCLSVCISYRFCVTSSIWKQIVYRIWNDININIFPFFCFSNCFYTQYIWSMLLLDFSVNLIFSFDFFVVSCQNECQSILILIIMIIDCYYAPKTMHTVFYIFFFFFSLLFVILDTFNTIFSANYFCQVFSNK